MDVVTYDQNNILIRVDKPPCCLSLDEGPVDIVQRPRTCPHFHLDMQGKLDGLHEIGQNCRKMLKGFHLDHKNKTNCSLVKWSKLERK